MDRIIVVYNSRCCYRTNENVPRTILYRILRMLGESSNPIRTLLKLVVVMAFIVHLVADTLLLDVRCRTIVLTDHSSAGRIVLSGAAHLLRRYRLLCGGY